MNILVIHFAHQAAQSRVVKDFVSRVSHDLRSPLASVKLNVETVLKRELSPETGPGLPRDRPGGNWAAWRPASRASSRPPGWSGASCGSRRIPWISANSSRGYLERKRDLVARSGGFLHIGPLQAPPVQADPAMMEKILDNLVDNALGHCPPGVHIRVSLTRQNRLALVTVADDGPGIPPKERDKVFRLFYRAKAAQGRGTGLGLFIVASLVKAHGGQVWVECPGVGSCFQVALPLDEDGGRHP